MATPPQSPPFAPGRAAEARTSAIGKQPPHVAHAASVQWVSCSKTTHPSASKRKITARLAAATVVCGSSIHRTFHEAAFMATPAVPRRSAVLA
jgi:hypothetical protein